MNGTRFVVYSTSLSSFTKNSLPSKDPKKWKDELPERNGKTLGKKDSLTLSWAVGQVGSETGHPSFLRGPFVTHDAREEGWRVRTQRRREETTNWRTVPVRVVCVLFILFLLGHNKVSSRTPLPSHLCYTCYIGNDPREVLSPSLINPPYNGVEDFHHPSYLLTASTLTISRPFST